MNQGRSKDDGWSTANKINPPSNFIAGRPKATLLCFGSLVILDAVCRHLSLLLLNINIKISKNRC